jgi:hypothetical protein
MYAIKGNYVIIHIYIYTRTRDYYFVHIKNLNLFRPAPLFVSISESLDL